MALSFVFVFYIISILANLQTSIGDDVKIAKIRSRRVVKLFETGSKLLEPAVTKFVETGGKMGLKWFRGYKANQILMEDAKLIKVDENLHARWYKKAGGMRKAKEDFWMLSPHDKKKKKTELDLYFKYQLAESGTVGDSTVEFFKTVNIRGQLGSVVAKYKMTSPQVGRGTVIIVLYMYRRR